MTQRTAGDIMMTQAQTEVTVLTLAVPVVLPSDGATQACKIIQATRWNRAVRSRSEPESAGPNRTPGCPALPQASETDSESESACRTGSGSLSLRLGLRLAAARARGADTQRNGN